LTAGWGFQPHATLLKEARKGGVVGRRRPTKSEKMRGESLGLKEELEIIVLVIGNGGEGYDTS
jgi:hypothetical protein